MFALLILNSIILLALLILLVYLIISIKKAYKNLVELNQVWRFLPPEEKITKKEESKSKEELEDRWMK